MPATRQPPARRLNYRSLPLWFQWALPFTVAGALVIALVVWVHYENHHVPTVAAVINPSALSAQNAQAKTIMRQQQAPHSARLTPGLAPATGLERAIAHWLRRQIATGAMNGPLSGGSCVPTPGSTSARVALRCTMVTAQVNYPFYGVVVPAKGQITYCQRVTPPVYGMDNLPLSPRCTAG